MQRFLTLTEVSQLLGGRSRSSIYVDVAAGRLPRPLKFGARIYWAEDALAAHLRRLEAGQAEAREAPAGRDVAADDRA